MQDQPTPSEILAAVAGFLRDVVAAEAKPHTAFQARVAANALDLTRRHIDIAPAAEASEQARLSALLGHDGALADLNGELARRIAAGEFELSTPGLAEHLWATTLAKLAVDQPNYS